MIPIRIPAIKFIIGSTVDEIEKQFNSIFSDTCPGNIVKTQLYKWNDSTYCYEVRYASVKIGE